VHLFAPGGDLVDSVRYGLQAEEYSIGRAVDGAGSWVLTAPTPAQQRGRRAGRRLGPARERVDGRSGFRRRLVRVCNTGALPVALGGLCLSRIRSTRR